MFMKWKEEDGSGETEIEKRKEGQGNTVFRASVQE